MFPNAFYNGREWDMAATGRKVSLPYTPYENVYAITPEVFTDEEYRVMNKYLIDRAKEVLYGK